MKTAVEQQAATNQLLTGQGAQVRVGSCLGIDWTATPEPLAQVNIPGGTVWLPMSGVPIINERCRVGYLGGQLVVLGPVVRPPFGTTTGTPSAGLVSVVCDDGIIRKCAYSSGMSLASGTRVLVDWTSGGTVVALPTADPNTGTPISSPGDIGGGGQKSATFAPYSSGTWRDGVYASGWVAGEAWDSDHNRGGWFYQGIADTIPDTARLVSFRWYAALTGGYGGNPSIGGHALPGMSGALSLTGKRTIPAASGWVDISDLFAAFANGSLLGVGTGGGGNWHFAPAGQANSGVIAAVWEA